VLGRGGLEPPTSAVMVLNAAPDPRLISGLGSAAAGFMRYPVQTARAVRVMPAGDAQFLRAMTTFRNTNPAIRRCRLRTGMKRTRASGKREPAPGRADV
jgi:hypothetical protein